MTIADLVDSWRGRKYRIFKTDIRGSSVSGVGEVNSGEVLFFSLSLFYALRYSPTHLPLLSMGLGPLGLSHLKKACRLTFHDDRQR